MAPFYLTGGEPNWLCRFLEPLTGVQNSKADNLLTIITNDYILIRHFAVRGITGLLEIHIQRVRLCIIGQSDRMLRRLIDGRNQLQIFLKINYGHNCFLFAKERTRRVKNAVITNFAITQAGGNNPRLG